MNQHTDWHKMWNPRASMSFNSAKGLLNEPGQNNCFVNSAVQVLWHMDAFRRSFRMLSGHACMGNSCIFCALKVIFTQFQYSDQSALPPDALRRALARTFRDQQRFQLNLMDDAAECFENILTRIHFHIANGVSEDMCNARHCIPHQKFSMTIVEQLICQACKVSSEPHSFNQTVHYVSASALVGQHKTMSSLMSGPVPDHMFGQILREASSQGDTRDCPSNCGRRVFINRSLTNSPDVVSIGVIWDSDRPSLDHIKDVVRSIGTIIRLRDLFDHVVDEYSQHAELHLVGVVCYYGKHYSTFFFHSKMKKWISFDDANVKEMGSQWCTVAEKCCRGHYQPLLLLYSIENAQPIDMETAPQSTVMLPGYNFGKDAGIPEEGSHNQQSSSSERNRTVGGGYPSTSSSSASSNYETTLQSGADQQLLPTEPYNPVYSGSSTSGTSRLCRTTEPELGRSTQASSSSSSSSSTAPYVSTLTNNAANGIGSVNNNAWPPPPPPALSVTVAAPQWGNYRSDDDDDDHLSHGLGKLEITHTRQPSYLDAVDGSDGGGGGGGGGGCSGQGGQQEECTCGISSQHKLSSNNDTVQYSSVASGGAAGYAYSGGQQQGVAAAAAGAGYSAGHYGQIRATATSHAPPQYSQLGRQGQTDLLGPIPSHLYEQQAQQFSNQTAYPDTTNNGTHTYPSGAADQFADGHYVAASSPVSRSNSQLRPMAVDDMLVNHSRLHPSQADANTTNLKRVKSMENSLGGVADPSLLSASTSSSHRPQSARPYPAPAPTRSMGGWLDGDGDDYGTYINRKSVQSVMNKLQKPCNGSARIVKEHSLKLDIPDTASLGSASLKDSGYRSGGSGGDRNSAASSMESPTVIMTAPHETTTCTSYKHHTVHSCSSSSSSSSSTYPTNVLSKSCVSLPHTANRSSAVSAAASTSSSSAATLRAAPPVGVAALPRPAHLPARAHPPVPASGLAVRGGVGGGVAGGHGSSVGTAAGSRDTTQQSKSVRELAQALETQQTPLQQRPPSPLKQPSKPRTSNRNPSSISNDVEFQRLCLQSEGLMENSVEKESHGDLHMALAKCTQAIGVLQGALGRPGSSKDEAAAHHLRMKLNAAVLRSRGLHKRISQQPQGDTSPPTDTNDDKHSISSSTSTDTSERFPHNNSRDLISLEASAFDQQHQQLQNQVKQLYQAGPPHAVNGFTGRCPPQKHPPGTVPPQAKPSLQPKPPPLPHTHLQAFDESGSGGGGGGAGKPATRRTFTSDYISREEYFANHPPPPNKQVPGLVANNNSNNSSSSSSSRPQMHKSATDSAISDKSRPKIPPKPPTRTTSIDNKPGGAEDEGNSGDNSGPIDIYATLPRKGKKARSSTLNGNQQAEVYQAYLERQKQQQQQQHDGDGVDGGGDGGTAEDGLVISHTRQWSKEEIRELLYKDFVRKGEGEAAEKPAARVVQHRRQSSGNLLDTSRQYSEQQQQSQKCTQQNLQQPPYNQPPTYQHQPLPVNLSQAPPQYRQGPTQFTVNQAVQPQRQFCQPVDPQQHPFVTDRKATYDPMPLTGVPIVDIKTDNVRPSVIDKLDKIHSKQGLQHPQQQPQQQQYQQQHQQHQQQQQQYNQNGMYPPPHTATPAAAAANNNNKHDPRNISSTTTTTSSLQGHHYAPHMNGTTVRPLSASSIASIDVPSSSPAETTTASNPAPSESPSKSPTPIKTSAHYVPPPVAPPTMGLPMDPPPTLAPPTMPPLYMKSQLQEDSSTFTDSNYSSNDRTDTQSDTSASTGSHGGSSGSHGPHHRRQHAALSALTPTKSALVKKKRKSRGSSEARKNVTFSDHVALIAVNEQLDPNMQHQDQTDYMKYVSDLLNNSKKAKQKAQPHQSKSQQPKELTSCLKSRSQTPVASVVEKDHLAKTGYDSDFDENTSDSCTSDEAQTDKVRCNLCRKKLIELTQMYCNDCTYYMSQFQPTTQVS